MAMAWDNSLFVKTVFTSNCLCLIREVLKEIEIILNNELTGNSDVEMHNHWNEKFTRQA